MRSQRCKFVGYGLVVVACVLSVLMGRPSAATVIAAIVGALMVATYFFKSNLPRRAMAWLTIVAVFVGGALSAYVNLAGGL